MSVSERRGSGLLKNIMQTDRGQMRGDLRIKRIGILLAALFLGAATAVSPALAKHHDDDEDWHHEHKHWHEYPRHVYAPPPVVYVPPPIYPPPPPVVFAPAPSINIVIPLPH